MPRSGSSSRWGATATWRRRPDTIRGEYFDGVVIDETGQIKPYLWGSVIRPMLADRKGWALFIGTPQGINLLSQLYYSALADPSWYVALFTCYDTKALPDAEIESMRTDPNMSETQFRQEMLCDFTAQSVNTLISIEQALAAAQRKLEDRLYDFAPRILGVDVAWQGGDRCAMFPRQGLQAFKPTVIPGLPEKTFWGVVARKIQEWQPHMTFVDVTGGYGGEVVSRLHDAGYKSRRQKPTVLRARSKSRFSRPSPSWARSRRTSGPATCQRAHARHHAGNAKVGSRGRAAALVDRTDCDRRRRGRGRHAAGRAAVTRRGVMSS
jgi:hypothetical protein